MNIILDKDIPDKALIECRVLTGISFGDRTVLKLMDSIKEVDERVILKLLNSINNQNIQSIDVRTYSYVHRNEKLVFSDLAKSEKLFLAAFATNYSKIEIYFCNELQSLTQRTLRLFLRTFKSSKYVNIYCTSPNYKTMYEYILREVSL